MNSVLGHVVYKKWRSFCFVFLSCCHILYRKLVGNALTDSRERKDLEKIGGTWFHFFSHALLFPPKPAVTSASVEDGSSLRCRDEHPQASEIRLLKLLKQARKSLGQAPTLQRRAPKSP